MGEASIVYDEYRRLFRIIYMNTAGEIRKIVFRNFEQLRKKLKSKIVFIPSPKRNIIYYSAKELFYTSNYIYLIYMNPSIYQPVLLKVAFF
jgi:hypothetical protein